jgi:hypothetical protein
VASEWHFLPKQGEIGGILIAETSGSSGIVPLVPHSSTHARGEVEADGSVVIVNAPPSKSNLPSPSYIHSHSRYTKHTARQTRGYHSDHPIIPQEPATMVKITFKTVQNKVRDEAMSSTLRCAELIVLSCSLSTRKTTRLSVPKASSRSSGLTEEADLSR